MTPLAGGGPVHRLFGVVEDDGQLRLRPNAGPTKAFELQRTQGADVRAFQEVAPPPKKQKTTEDEDEDPVTGRLLGRPQGTLVPRPAAGTSDDPVLVFDDDEGKRADHPIEVG